MLQMEVSDKMQQNFIISGDVYTAKIWKEHNVYVAECPELGISSTGKTTKSARLHLKEATKIHLEGGSQGKEKA